MSFYRGYIPCKDKKPITSYKNKKLNTLDEVQNQYEFAGVLAEDAVLIDVDDEPQSELLLQMVKDLELKCQVLKSNRGMHFLFKNTDVIEKSFTKQSVCVGLVNIDCKCGKSATYEVLRKDGTDREILYDTGEYEVVPKWLKPIKRRLPFLNMTAGDGRNQELFNYILVLQSNDFTVDETRETIRILNRYVLPDPLEESELDVVLRDDAFKKPIFYNGTTFLFDKFATFLKNHHYIKRVDGRLHIYHDGIYISDYAEIEACMIQHIPTLNRTKRAEVVAYLELLCRENEEPAPPYMIAFRNGVYNLNTNEFSGFTPDLIITNKIPWDFNEQAYCKTTDDVLNNLSCNDKHIRMLLEEMIGACMYRSAHLAGGKAFILIGSGANGKSTYLDMLKRMLGEENTSVLDIKRLDDRFSTQMLQNKLANIGDDLSDGMVFDDSTFKKIVTGQRLDAEQKGLSKFEFSPYCKLVFSANNIPRIGKGKDSQAVMRRLIIIPFNAKFNSSDSNFNPNICEELRSAESMEYLIQIGIDALFDLIQNKNYTKSEKVEFELSEYEKQNNPILLFIEHCEFEYWNIIGESTGVVYDRYKDFCYSENLQPLSKVWFSRQITKTLNLTTASKKINGKKHHVFVEEE